MPTKHHKFQIIEKEKISELIFLEKEVLKTIDDFSKRKSEIHMAMLLGNKYKGKVKIIFEDSEGTKQVETTVWGVTDKYVLLKKGLMLPIHRILEIKI